MRHKKADLIVPIRDRRQRRRVLTLRNSGYALLACVVAFLAITIHSEMRHGTPDGDYGRLYHRELPPPPNAEPKALAIVEEAKPVDDQISADPMLTASAARGQFLESDAAAVVAVPAPPIATPLAFDAPRDGNARVAIVGGPGGVAAVGNAPVRTQQKLKGGIFRN